MYVMVAFSAYRREKMIMIRKDDSMRKKSLPKVDKKVRLVRESEFRRGKL